LRFFIKPIGLIVALQRFPLTRLAAFPALTTSSVMSGILALLSFGAFQAFLRWIFEEAFPFLMPLSLFLFRPPKNAKAEASGDSFQRCSVSLLSRGAHLLGVPDRLSFATLLGRGSVAAYFFSSGPQKTHVF
jgi:hypothetical protein